MNAIVTVYHVDARASRLLRFPEVHDRWKIHADVDDLVAASAEIEAARHNSLANGHILVHADRSGRRIHNCADLIAHLAGQHPPTVFPGAHPAARPGVTV